MRQQGEFDLSFWCHIPLVRDGGTLIHTPKDAADEMVEIRDAAQEMFGVLYLNIRNRLLDKKIVTVGLLDHCLVHPREVFRHAIVSLSAGIVVCHNHPSGDPTPSAEDVRITRELIQTGKIVGIKVMDHIILGRAQPDRSHDFISLREGGLCEFDKG